MEFYRAYAQPDRPDNFRVFGFDVVSDDNVQYSKALKDACKTRAGPKPRRPTECLRCGIVNAAFTSRVCYKVGIAGAWNMICLSCHKVHIPSQQGPTNEALEHIETIRARDHQAFLDRKAKKAKQRAKARAKAHKDHSEDEATAPGPSSTPFVILNNAADLLDTDPSGSDGGHKNMKAEKTESDLVARPPANYYMKGPRSHAGHPNGAPENPRTIELVFWARDQEPHVDQVPVQFEHELFLYEFPYFQNMRGPCAFECYAFEASLWCDLPWRMSPIPVGPEDDVIFICIMGVRCRGFGRLLDRYQRKHGLALSPALGIRATVDIPPLRHHWLVIWGQHNSAPEIHLVNLNLADGLDDEARLALPWAHLISDAPFLMIWREMESAWAVVGPGISSGVLEAPITLVAHPLTESLAGSGEAIAWLEAWRLGGGPRSRAATPTDRKAGRAKRALSPPPPDERVRLALATPTKKSKTRVLSAEASIDPFTGPASVGPVSAPRGRAAITPPGGHAQCTPDKKPRAPHPSLSVSQPEGLLDESTSAAHLDRACATKRPAPASSDDEVVLLEGPSTAPGRPRPPKKIRASAVSDDDVEVIDGPPAAKAPHQSSKKPRVSASTDDGVVIDEGPLGTQTRCSSKKQKGASPPSPLSDDNVVLIEQPSAALTRRFAKKARSSTLSAPSDDVVIVDGPAHSSGTRRRRPGASSTGAETGRAGAAESSDDEVEFVDDASIVPKRRVSNVNGCEVIDLT